jgi:hypothetical protein
MDRASLASGPQLDNRIFPAIGPRGRSGML